MYIHVRYLVMFFIQSMSKNVLTLRNVNTSLLFMKGTENTQLHVHVAGNVRNGKLDDCIHGHVRKVHE